MTKNLVFDFGRVLVDYDFDIYIDSIFRGEPGVREFKEVVCDPAFVAECDLGALSFADLMHGIAVRYPQWERQAQEYLDRQFDLIKGEIPGMRELLQDLKSKGYRLFGLSNWGDTVYSVIERFEIFKLLEGRLISSEELMLKPNRDIYQRFFEKFNLKPEECLFTDDKPENVKGSVEAGMPAVLFTDTQHYIEDLRRLGII